MSSVDVEAISGIFGSISIACWVVVFTPQILENYRRSSADGLSIVFVITWLLGDVFNILGAALQGVQSTMLILAVYYTIADIVLLAQCFYYHGFTLTGAQSKPALLIDDESAVEHDELESSPLIPRESPAHGSSQRVMISDAEISRRSSSFSSILSQLNPVDTTRLSSTMPLIPNPTHSATSSPTLPQPSILGSILYNTSALLIVCLAGIVSWFVTTRFAHSQFNASTTTETGPLHIDIWGQIFGYLCAVLYLGSRVPQLLLNHRRKSTEGVSILFFLFACVGNLTYVFSILAYEPSCARVAGGGEYDDDNFCGRGEWSSKYARYVLVNASWILGSAGTLGLDLMIFAQFCWYRGRKVL
ncbi:hypothetical protein MMC07_007773 [Pseudocyphellaria aurata]|nr:hypothetical protein [Pseudocyphellaria aurata]